MVKVAFQTNQERMDYFRNTVETKNCPPDKTKAYISIFHLAQK